MTKSRETDTRHDYRLIDEETGEIRYVAPTNSAVNNTTETQQVLVDLEPGHSVRTAVSRPRFHKNNEEFAFYYIRPVHQLLQEQGLTNHEAALLFRLTALLDYDGYAYVEDDSGRTRQLTVKDCEALLCVSASTVNRILTGLEEKGVLIKESKGGSRSIRVNPLYMYRGKAPKREKALIQFEEIASAEKIHRSHQGKRGPKRSA